jgi:hypothetical protein
MKTNETECVSSLCRVIYFIIVYSEQTIMKRFDLLPFVSEKR